MDPHWINMVNIWIDEILGTKEDSGYPCEEAEIESDDNKDTEAEWIGKTNSLIINCETCSFHGIISIDKNPHIVSLKKHWFLKKRVTNCPRCGKQIAIASRPGEI